MIKNIQWHRIFNKKKFSYIKDTNKIKYKNINNFSYNLAKVIYPGLNHFKFLKITNFISKKLNIIIKKSILDFGSGNGSFLNYFVNKYNLKNNISLEISGPLLNQQKKFIKKTIFFKTHHTDTKVFDKLNANLVDYSMCNSVFQYFYNENYAYKVLDFLLKITKKKILIYDIKNSKTKKIYQEKVRKRQNLSILKFKEKYKKLARECNLAPSTVQADYPDVTMRMLKLSGLFVENDLIIATEHGPWSGDEINKITFNKNYGWPISSYGEEFDPIKQNKKGIKSPVYNKNHASHGFEEPIFSYVPAIGISEIIKLPNDFSNFWIDNFLISSLWGHSLHRVQFDKSYNKVIFSEKIFVGERTRDIEYHKKMEAILMAFEQSGELGFLTKQNLKN